MWTRHRLVFVVEQVGRAGELDEPPGYHVDGDVAGRRKETERRRAHLQPNRQQVVLKRALVDAEAVRGHPGRHDPLGGQRLAALQIAASVNDEQQHPLKGHQIVAQCDRFLLDDAASRLLRQLHDPAIGQRLDRIGVVVAMIDQAGLRKIRFAADFRREVRDRCTVSCDIAGINVGSAGRFADRVVLGVPEPPGIGHCASGK